MIRGLAMLVLLNAVTVSMGGDFPTFERKVIDPNAGKVVYAVTLADVNGDERDDIVAVTENRVICYEAPDWKPVTLIENQTKLDNVCIAPHDIDGDGTIDFALGAGWTKVGTIQWITRGEKPGDPWKVHFIGEELWTHRMRWAGVLGNDGKQLVVSPLKKSGNNAGARLTAFSIPKNPATDRWERHVIDETLNNVHNHWHIDLNGDDVEDTITASLEGIHAFFHDDGRFLKAKLPGSEGAGEIKVGRIGGRGPGKTDAKRGWFAVAIEPMHGTKVVVYPRDSPREGEKESGGRTVIETELARGHALWTADVDGDGSDEIVVGHSQPGPGNVKGPGVYIYDCVDDDGTKWEKHVIDDGGIATEDLIAADLTGDGRIDIVAGGRDTHNVVLYVQKPGAER